MLTIRHFMNSHARYVQRYGNVAAGNVGTFGNVSSVGHRYPSLCVARFATDNQKQNQSFPVGEEQRVSNLVNVLDGYFKNSGMHLNVNAVTKEVLQDAIEHPESYPNLTIRVSGYAVMWSSLTPEQRRDVLSRTFHEKI